MLNAKKAAPRRSRRGLWSRMRTLRSRAGMAAREKRDCRSSFCASGAIRPRSTVVLAEVELAGSEACAADAASPKISPVVADNAQVTVVFMSSPLHEGQFHERGAAQD